MTRYTVDGVAMARYLLDELPAAAGRVFDRAEQGVDTLEAPTVTIGETVWTIVNEGSVAGVDVDETPRAVLRGLVTDGPVQVAASGQRDLEVAGSLIDHHTLHDALLLASHRVQDTEAILTNDRAFASEQTVWE